MSVCFEVSVDGRLVPLVSLTSCLQTHRSHKNVLELMSNFTDFYFFFTGFQIIEVTVAKAVC